MRRTRRSAALVTTLFLGVVSAACERTVEPVSTSPAEVADAPAETEGAREVRSLCTGAVLDPAPLPEAFRTAQQQHLDVARQTLAADPSDLDAGIWVGRRLGYLGRTFEAIDHYSSMLERFPDEPRLLRHRGHRYLTVRDIAAAIHDLERAATLVAALDDRVEEDGLPNAQNIPTSTLKTNVYYHLGLAYFVHRRFAEAESAYRDCLRWSTNPDMEAATRQWLQASLARQNNVEAWAEVVAPVEADWALIENGAYHQLLLLAKGEREAQALLEPSDADGPSSAAMRFGIAHHLLHDPGHPADEREPPERAEAILEALVSDPGWAAFGVLAAEAELRERGSTRCTTAE
jgi:tetratricopeptide (TPR) repeat protein